MGSRAESLSDEDLVCRVFNQGAVNATNPDEEDDVIDTAPHVKAIDTLSVFSDLNEYMLWQE